MSFEPISMADFRARTGVDLHLGVQPEVVVSLRDVVPGSISHIQVMSKTYLSKLLSGITLQGDESHHPYADCDIELVSMDPNNLAVGQTFIQRGKILNMVEHFEDLFDGDFCVSRGVAGNSALIVQGQNQSGQQVMAHYVPPIVEVNNGTLFLLDGIHRNYLARSVGTNIQTVVVKGVMTPLPCGMGHWSDLRHRVMDEKPPEAERFIDLRPELYRNLKSTGIDG